MVFYILIRFALVKYARAIVHSCQVSLALQLTTISLDKYGVIAIIPFCIAIVLLYQLAIKEYAYNYVPLILVVACYEN